MAGVRRSERISIKRGLPVAVSEDQVKQYIEGNLKQVVENYVIPWCRLNAPHLLQTPLKTLKTAISKWTYPQVLEFFGITELSKLTDAYFYVPDAVVDDIVKELKLTMLTLDKPLNLMNETEKRRLMDQFVNHLVPLLARLVSLDQERQLELSDLKGREEYLFVFLKRLIFKGIEMKTEEMTKGRAQLMLALHVGWAENLFRDGDRGRIPLFGVVSTIDRWEFYAYTGGSGFYVSDVFTLDVDNREEVGLMAGRMLYYLTLGAKTAAQAMLDESDPVRVVLVAFFGGMKAAANAADAAQAHSTFRSTLSEEHVRELLRAAAAQMASVDPDEPPPKVARMGVDPETLCPA